MTGESGALDRPGSPGRGEGHRRVSALARPRVRRSPGVRLRPSTDDGEPGERDHGRQGGQGPPAGEGAAVLRGKERPEHQRQTGQRHEHRLTWRATAARPAANPTAARPAHGAVDGAPLAVGTRLTTARTTRATRTREKATVTRSSPCRTRTSPGPGARRTPPPSASRSRPGRSRCGTSPARPRCSPPLRGRPCRS